MSNKIKKNEVPALPSVYNNSRVGTILFFFGVFVFVLFVASSGFLIYAPENWKKGSLLFASAWVALVPVYFFCEHVFIFRSYGNPAQYEQFKRIQDLAAKIWAAAIVVMAACYSANYPSQTPQLTIPTEASDMEQSASRG